MSEFIPEQRTAQDKREALTGRIAYWQTFFDGIPADQLAIDERNEAQADLDNLWPYGDMECVFKGIGQRVVETTAGTLSKEEFIEEGTGKSWGLTICKFGKPDASQRWIVSYMFEDKEVQPHDDETGIISKHTFLEATQAVVVPLAEIEQAYESMYQPQVVLDELSSKLVDFTRNPEFYSLSAADQYFVIDDVLESARAAAARWGGIEERAVYLQVGRAFALRTSEGPPQYQELELIDQELAGVCQGLEVLARRQLARDVAITHPDQLVDSEAGLFLIVEVDSDTADLYGLSEDAQRLIYVPISGHDFGISFLETADAE